MSDERWKRLWEAFHEAAGKAAGERAAYLDSALGDDPALRAEVEELLAAAAQPGLTSPPELAAEGDGADGEAIGQRIGPYRLVGRLGEGGMGVVYAAEQEEPVRRRVALKLVKLGMDTREVVARFEAERQALASMDHPNIARVFDCGASARGRPYFVMELVAGVPITEYCDARRLDLGERIRLFLPVCRAVEHAHRKAILHRDLKPSNVLIAEVDGAPLAKVIDFGLAKAMAEPGAPDMTRTQLGRILGTPEYMSPEQALGGPDVDTRADVYSLGVILYELLAGRLPFAAMPTPERRSDAPPPRLSGSLGRDATQASEIASRRRTDLPGLRRALRGELEWIVVKALDPNRARRYGSAAELAADLERHLRHEPVLAAPPSRIYRGGRFVRRHRVAVGVAATVAAFVVGFAILNAFQAARLRRALAESHQVTRFLVDVFQVSDPATARGREVSAREILDRGAERIAAELSGQPQVQSTLMHVMGMVYRQLGAYDRAEALLTEALERRRRLAGKAAASDAAVAESLRELGRTHLARLDHARALATLTEALAQARRGAPRSDLAVAATLVDLAGARRMVADFAGAEAALAEALALQRDAGAGDVEVAKTMGVLGVVRHRRGAFAEAEVSYRQALELMRAAAGGDHPEIANWSSNLGALLFERGDVAAAEALYRDALSLQRRVLGAEHPRAATTMNNLALLLHERGEYAEAETLYGEVLSLNRKVHGAEHPNVAGNLNNLGLLFYDAGDFARAAPLFAQSLAMQERLFGAEHPNLGFPLNNLARLEHERGDLAAAEALYRRGLEIRRRALPAGHPDLAGSLTGFGGLLVDRGDARGGEALLREALEIRTDKLRAGDWRTAETQSVLGHGLAQQGRYDEAEALLRAARAALSARRGPADRRTVRTEAWLEALAAARARATARPAPPPTSG